MFCALLVCFVFVAQIAAKVGMDPCVVAQISFLLHRHYMQFYCSICNYTLCLFAHIQAKVGLDSCLVAQIDGFLHRHFTLSIFAYGLVYLHSSRQKLAWIHVLVAQETVLLCRDQIQLYLLLHVPSSFNYGEDRRRFVADPEGKGRGKWRRMIWRLEGSYLMLLPAMALYSLFLELKLFWPISSPSFALPWQHIFLVIWTGLVSISEIKLGIYVARKV